MDCERKARTYGYIRVSTKDQNEARQLIAMKEQGIPRRRLYIDKQSGKNFERTNYIKLVNKLQKDDLLIVESIDRLGRNYEEILNQWRIITKEIGADIRILDMSLLDTTISKDLIGTFIADLVLQVLSFVAESERNKIRKNQREGIDAALARGVHFGRTKKEGPEIDKAIRLYLEKKIKLSDAVEISGLSRSSFYDHLHDVSGGRITEDKLKDGMSRPVFCYERCAIFPVHPEAAAGMQGPLPHVSGHQCGLPQAVRK